MKEKNGHKKMGKVFVLGTFGYTTNQLDGQTIKTRNVYDLLTNNYAGKVSKVDTLEIRKKPWLILSLLANLISCKTVVLLPGFNNMTYFFPIVFFLSKVFKFEIVSICIGGWQVEYFSGDERYKPHPSQLQYSKNIKAFLPELEKVNNDLTVLFGFANTEVLPNFRKFELKAIRNDINKELRLVFMARINKYKGYPAIFELLSRLDKQGIEYSMTFYGPIIDRDRMDFLNKIKNGKCVKYEGLLMPDEIHNTLADYDVLLLPTQYYTEGFPGSILDAYIAGIPVIVTEWKHSHEFVVDGKTGFIVPFKEGLDLMVDRVKWLNENRDKLQQMKYYSQLEAKKYSEDAAWNVLKKYL